MFRKFLDNPILLPNKENSWENFCVLNPAVVFDDKTNIFVMVYRAGGDDIKHKITLGLATSDDGFHFTRCYNHPVFETNENDADGGCAEDPRIVKIDDYYYMTYASRAFAPGRYWLPNFKEERTAWFKPQKDTVPAFYRINHTVTYLAMTKDFVNYTKLGRITDSRIDDRDVVIFPKKINNRFVRINRPNINDTYYMHIAFSDDLLEWKESKVLYKGVEDWENYKVGASCHPIETDKGWLLIYHAVDNQKFEYRVGVLLLDKNDPRKIIGRTKNPVLEPDQKYEKTGLYNGCVFPTGVVLKDNTLYLYYGCADKFISVATAKLEEIYSCLGIK